jgi:4-hydroxy-3-polyprenylbenzoate decarboxylase
MAYRCQPQYDLHVLPHKDPGHGPRGPRDGGESAAVLINAMLKSTYAPVALPKREFMENARRLWERLGLPPLKAQTPWHGYDLGHWPEELDRQARMATAGDYFALGDILAQQRRGDVAMNTPVPHDGSETGDTGNTAPELDGNDP